MQRVLDEAQLHVDMTLTDGTQLTAKTGMGKQAAPASYKGKVALESDLVELLFSETMVDPGHMYLVTEGAKAGHMFIMGGDLYTAENRYWVDLGKIWGTDGTDGVSVTDVTLEIVPVITDI